MRGTSRLVLGGLMGLVLGLTGCAQDDTPGANPLACDPAVDQERCEDSTRMSCDPATNLWSALEVCDADAPCAVEAGTSFCEEVPATVDAGPSDPGDTTTTVADAGPQEPDTMGPVGDAVVIPETTCVTAGDCIGDFTGPACCNDAGVCDIDTDMDDVCNTDDACPGADDHLFVDGSCEECADPNFTGAACDECADPKFTGEACDECADTKFTGEACDECADPKFTGEGCNLCSDPKFTGLNCDQCIDLTWTGPNCDECAYPCGNGSCDVCETLESCPADCAEEPPPSGCVADIDCPIGQVCTDGECGDPPPPPTEDQCQLDPTCECALDHCTDQTSGGGMEDPGGMGGMGEFDLSAQICGTESEGGGMMGGGMMGMMGEDDDSLTPSDECLDLMLGDYKAKGCSSNCAPDGVATLFGQDAVCQESLCEEFLNSVVSEDDAGGMMGMGGGAGLNVDCGVCQGEGGGGTCSTDADCIAGEICLDGVCFEDQSASCNEDPDCACAVLTCGDAGAIVNSGGICAAMEANGECWNLVHEAFGEDGCQSACYGDQGKGPLPGIDQLCFKAECAPVLTIVGDSLGYDICQSCPAVDPTVCVTNADCPGGDQCVDGDCQETGNVQCVDASQCPADHVCDEGWCKEPEPVPPCTNDGDCAQGEFCQNGDCIEDTGPCSADADCPFGTLCIGGECQEGQPVTQCQQSPTCDCAFDQCDQGGGGGMFDPKDSVCGGDDEGGGGMMGGMMGMGGGDDSGPSEACLDLMLTDFGSKGCSSTCAPNGTATLFGQDAVCQQAACGDYLESLTTEDGGGGGGMMGGMMGGGGGGIEIDCGTCN